MKLKNALLALLLMQSPLFATELRIATFNVSMDATNYTKQGENVNAQILTELLASGEHQQIKNIAEIIQRTAPDIILLNEFDFIEDKRKGVDLFVKNYLAVSHNQQTPINYQYSFVAPVNTGVATKYDLDNDGVASGVKNDAFGFGFYPGHYGMAILSKYPINESAIRTLQYFKWHDMPNAKKPMLNGKSYYTDDEWKALRLSSKSHWDVPVEVNGKTLHLLALHPTPPVFDGPEDRNGKRNADEIRLVADYINPNKSGYIYDDNSMKGGLVANTRFVVAGDLNAADIGDKYRDGVIEQLTRSDYINSNAIPVSDGARQSNSNVKYANRYTASWQARVDYVLPSKYGISVIDSGVFWPVKQSPLYRLIENRKASSDHRLVWLDIKIEN